MSSLDPRRCRAEGEVEGGALADGAFGPDAAAVTFDDPLDAGQADAGTGEIGNRVEPLERLEQLVDEGGIEAGPVVADVAADVGVPGRSSAELDGGVLAFGGELPGVLDQVLQHGADQGAVRGDPDAVVDGEADGATRLAGVQLGAEGGDLGGQVDRFGVHVGTRDLGQYQQVIDELAHPLGGGLDPVGVPAAGAVETVAVVLDQRLAVPAQRPQRGPQVMSDRVGERLQVLVRRQ